MATRAENHAAAPFAERFFESRDGLRLFMRDYGAAQTEGPPVVCLPGLTRNSADFAPLAQALSSGAAGGRRRRVLALDYRGRGRSAFDPDWRNYSLPVEGDDILRALDFARIERAFFVGTSRGGMLAMLLGALRPSCLAGVVLNDIGPVIERRGLDRIRGYVGKYPPPTTLEEGVAYLKKTMSGFSVPEESWRAYAAATFVDEAGRVGARYDPAIGKAFADFAPDGELTEKMWALFDALREVPLMILRGETSDLLSPETVSEMTRRHPGARTLTVAGQGHAPFLADAATIGAIGGFIAQAEAASPPPPAAAASSQ